MYHRAGVHGGLSAYCASFGITCLQRTRHETGCILCFALTYHASQLEAQLMRQGRTASTACGLRAEGGSACFVIS